MMGWKYDSSVGGMMGSWDGGVLFSAYHIVILIDLILLGLWLWKHLQKK